MVEKEDFFKDLSVALDYWTRLSVDAMRDGSSVLAWSECRSSYDAMSEALARTGVKDEDIQAVMSECFRGLLVNVLSIVDGASAMAEKGRVYLVDEEGEHLGEGLHQSFVDYLFDSGKLN